MPFGPAVLDPRYTVAYTDGDDVSACGDLVRLTSQGQFVPGLARYIGQTGTVIADHESDLLVDFGDGSRLVPANAVRGA